MHKQFKILLFFLIIFFLVFLFIYQNGYGKKNKFVFSPKWVNQSQFAGVFVAKEKGFYEDNGLLVEIDPFELGDSVIDDIRSGKSQAGLMSATDFLAEYAKSEDIEAVAVFFQVSPYVIVSLKSQGIESPFDFQGKTLGLKGGSRAEVAANYDILLASTGLSQDDASYKFLDLDSSEKEDLLSGNVDTVGLYRTRLYQFDVENIPYNIIYPEQYGSAIYNDVLVVSKNFLKEHGDQVEAFVKATVRGWEYAFKNKDDAVDITLSYISDSDLKNFDYQKYVLIESEKMIQPDKSKNIGIMDGGSWERFYNVLRKRGYINKEIDTNDVFNNEFVK